MKRSKLIITGLLILALWAIPTSMMAAEGLSKGVRFLDYVKKVEWYKVEGEHIIIGWKGLPDDFYNLNYKTALDASKLSQYKVFVWAVRYKQKDWSPGEGGQICITSAIRGRFEKTSCRK